MYLLYPKFPLRRLPAMLGLGVVGAVLAGSYGALHDQLSFTISAEYFTQLKFRQFHWANAGLPPRVFASVVGFLATWWAGLITGWVLARLGLDEFPAAERRRTAGRAFAIVLGAAVVFGLLGMAIGYKVSRDDLGGWDGWRDRLALQDVPGFVIVAWLHASGYAGAVVGLVIAVVYVRRCRRKPRAI